MKRSKNGAAAPTPETDELTPAERDFLEHYLANGNNGTKAWQATRPGVSDESAAVLASRLLRKVKVREFLDRERQARWKRLKMDADEGLALISAAARSDIGLLYDEKDNLLPVRQWPRWMRMNVKSIKHGADGSVTVTLHDALKARELMAIEAGHLRARVDVQHDFPHRALLSLLPPDGDAA